MVPGSPRIALPSRVSLATSAAPSAAPALFRASARPGTRNPTTSAAAPRSSSGSSTQPHLRPRRSSVATHCSQALVLSRNNARFRQLPLDGSLANYDIPAPEDYYSLLRLDPNTSPSSDDIKAAYRQLQRVVHPDKVGAAATSLAVILNACYETLMDDNARATYDFELKQYNKGVGTFDGRPVSMWMGAAEETRAVFVAENECIGCRQCTQRAPETFVMEEEHGRARVSKQWADDEQSIQEAVESCPVDCIYFVEKSQLALLEFVMKGCKRENVSIMLRRRSGNMGSPSSNECPFTRAVTYIRARKDAKLDSVFGGGRARSHDKVLAAAIAHAWLELPLEVRDQGWPEWSTSFL